VKVEDFVAGVSTLRDAIERLEKRIDRIGQSGNAD
jgi:ubiquinone biosynthesis protein UbiJ